MMKPPGDACFPSAGNPLGIVGRINFANAAAAGGANNAHTFEVKDSGARQTFDSGMQRDTQDGKIMYHLVASGPMFKRWAEHLTKGAQKYTADNWMKANGQAELDRFRASAFRHFMAWFNGEVDEDHAAATYFNINGAAYVTDKMRAA